MMNAKKARKASRMTNVQFPIINAAAEIASRPNRSGILPPLRGSFVRGPGPAVPFSHPRLNSAGPSGLEMNIEN